MNVATILDDNQMSYRDIKDFVTSARYEKYSKELESAEAPDDQNEVETRLTDEFSFRDKWGGGLAMDWTYVPKERQKCHINWRQSINDDGSQIGRLKSWPYMYDRPKMQGGPNAGAKSSDMKKNVDSMNSYKNVEPEQKAAAEAAIAAGKQEGERAKESDDAKNKICCDWQADISAAIKEKNAKVDMLTIASIMYCSGSTNAKEVVEKYCQTVQDLGTENPAVVIPAMFSGKEIILGGGNLKPIWEVPLYTEKEEEKGKDNAGDGSGSENGKQRVEAPKLNKAEIGSWLYGDPLYLERLIKQLKEVGGDPNLFPRVAYVYVALEPMLTSSPYDEGDNAFPFTNDTLRDVAVYYTSPFGMRTMNGETKLHRGVDLACDEGTPFVAAHDGTVAAAGDGWGADWNAICIDHGDGYYSRYLHCSEICCSTGQTVKKGEVIGKVGGVGPDGPDQYGAHLHFEFCTGSANETSSNTDPLSFYPHFNTPLDERVQAI